LARRHHLSHDASDAIGAQVNDQALSGNSDAPHQQLDDAGLFGVMMMEPRS
jgi:hypothetical protein